MIRSSSSFLFSSSSPPGCTYTVVHTCVWTWNLGCATSTCLRDKLHFKITGPKLRPWENYSDNRERASAPNAYIHFFEWQISKTRKQDLCLWEMCFLVTDRKMTSFLILRLKIKTEEKKPESRTTLTPYDKIIAVPLVLTAVTDQTDNALPLSSLGAMLTPPYRVI